MILRSLYIIGALLLLGMSGALAAGEYQQTKNGKTMVWNSEPKPGDEVKWSGGRDDEGYASGFGTLTWYTLQREKGRTKPRVYATYFGRMARGKLEGPVNVHVEGKTRNAIFVDGQRKTRWGVGTTASWTMPEQFAQQAAKIAAANSAKKAAATEPAAPAEGPKIAKAETKIQPPEPVHSASPPPQVQRQVIPPHVREEIKRPVENKPAKSEPEKSGPVDIRSPILDEHHRAPVEDIPGEGPGAPTGMAGAAIDSPAPSKVIPPSPAKTDKPPRTEVDDSLQALVGPPSSLHRTRETAPVSESSRLTSQEAAELADAEARRRGYNTAQFQRGDPEYSKEDRTWSLIYDQPAPAGADEPGTHFRVTVDDKTKGTVFVLRR